jgi:hypothetical protein
LNDFQEALVFASAGGETTGKYSLFVIENDRNAKVIENSARNPSRKAIACSRRV